MINSVTGTKDLQHVNISLRVLSRPVEQKLPEIFSKIGIDFDERVLPGVGNEVLKAVVVRSVVLVVLVLVDAWLVDCNTPGPSHRRDPPNDKPR